MTEVIMIVEKRNICCAMDLRYALNILKWNFRRFLPTKSCLDILLDNRIFFEWVFWCGDNWVQTLSTQH